MSELRVGLVGCGAFSEIESVTAVARCEEIVDQNIWISAGMRSGVAWGDAA